MSVRCPGHTNSCYKRYKLLHAGGSGVRLYDGTDIKLFILVGLDRRFLSVAWPTEVQLVFFFFLLLRVSVSYSAPMDLHRRAAY